MCPRIFRGFLERREAMMGRRQMVLGALAILAPLLVASCTMDGSYKFSQSSIETKSLPVSGVATLETRLGAADVTIVTKEGPEAEFIIKKTYKAKDKEYGEKLLRETEITIQKEGSRIILERNEKDKIKTDFLFRGYVSVEVTATLPSAVGLDILTGSGDLEIDERTGAVLVRSGSGDTRISKAGGGLEVAAGSGDVRVREASGRVKFTSGSGDFFATSIDGRVDGSTGSGDINIERIVGDADLSSGSGDISVDASAGVLKAKTGSGDLEFRSHAGSADVATSSGEIDFTASSNEGDVFLKTSSGDVSVTLLGVTSMEMSVMTTSGTIESKVPIVLKEATRRRLVGLMDGGQLKLAIETTSGDITVVPGSI
jgi:hypothetical protein